jgi:hypothetical protein
MPINILTVKSLKFPLGQIVITANANAQLESQAVNEGLIRHAAGDWGELCLEDARQNDLYFGDEGFRLLSVYGTGAKKFWIITESDRSVTTVLMPEDY